MDVTDARERLRAATDCRLPARSTLRRPPYNAAAHTAGHRTSSETRRSMLWGGRNPFNADVGVVSSTEGRKRADASQGRSDETKGSGGQDVGLLAPPGIRPHGMQKRGLWTQNPTRVASGRAWTDPAPIA
eukprot:363901-Chlamydomonas_euryale.AAC.11